MNKKIIQWAMIVAVIAVVIGVICRLSDSTIIFSSRAWHMFAQTSLLFGIAWGVAILMAKGNKAPLP